MMINNTHICYFPTQTILIDDNKDFLNSLLLNLDTNHQSYKCFSNVQSAIEFIKTNYSSSQWSSKHINILEEEKLGCNLVEFNIHDLYKQIYNKKRFNIITTIIADFDMPEINGLQMFQELKHLDIHKILLTGAADETLAVDAFNNKLINNFIKKSSNLIYEKLHDSIKLGQNIYFNKISKTILESYSSNSLHSIRNHPTFMELFNNVINENNIVEYYMVERETKYLLVSKSGQLSMFFIYPENHLQSFYQLASEENFIPELLPQLKAYKKMACVDDLNGSLLKDFDDYKQYLLNTEKLSIKNSNYYFAYNPHITHNDIYSFSEVLSK